jgi:hypothetical protein
VNNWKVILATVVIFGAGVITGSLVLHCVQRCASKEECVTPAMATGGQVPLAPPATPPGHPAENGKPRLPEAMNKQFLQRLDEELHLSPAQHKAIQKIIAEGQHQIRKVIHDQRLEIREELTPAQRKQFDELVKHQVHHPATETNAPAILPAETNSPASPVLSTNAP